MLMTTPRRSQATLLSGCWDWLKPAAQIEVLQVRGDLTEQG